MKLKHIIFVICLLGTVGAMAEETAQVSQVQVDKWQKWGPTSKSGWGFLWRVGYSIGGTTPLPLPAEIRSIDGFRPLGGFSIGFEGYKMLSKRWGVRLGLFMVNQGMNTEAHVKNYYTKITKEDGNTQKGWYTGCNSTRLSTNAFVIPLTATFRISPRWNVSAGPYLSVYESKSFRTTISDGGDPNSGYMRIDEGNGPTGTKTFPGTVTTDLSKDLRTCGVGMNLGFDWKAWRHIGMFGKLDWGLTSIFPGGYETVRFKMYPVYGTVGLFYCY